MMDALFDKMKEYLGMETEIPFAEFDTYYKSLLDYLGPNWETLNEEDSIRMLFILDNVKSNAEDRANRKQKEMKKYKKMAERLNLWSQAMFKRMVTEFGLSEEEISQRYEAIYEAV